MSAEETAASRAVAELRRLGLTEYAAKAFVGLVRLGRGSAREVAEISGVPRSRVYDVLDDLHREGIVDVQQSTPRIYRPLDVETAVGRFRQKHDESVSEFRTAVEELETVDGDDRDGLEGVWVVTNEERILELEARLIEGATEEVIVGIGSEAVLDRETLYHIRSADDVEVAVEAPTPDTRERIARQVDDAEVFAASRPWRLKSGLEGDVGRILVVDREAVLVSSLADEATEGSREVGIWSRGTGAGTGLVLALGQLMIDRVDEARNGV